MLDVTAGDTVFTYSRHGKDRTETTVDRVARKYFYVKNRWNQDEAYSLEDGQGRGEWSGYARTPAMEEDIRRRQEAQSTIDRHGLDVVWYRSQTLTTEQLEALAAVVATFPVDPRRVK